jgi:hydroxyethylthiazole kinase
VSGNRCAGLRGNANPSNLIRIMPAEGAEMRASRSNPLISDLPDIAADVVARVREKSPRVHCLTNTVAQNFTANVLLAAGAVPSMTVAPDEIADFVARADALLINLGTFDRERREAAEIAAEEAIEEQRPWVLDPVFVDRSQVRCSFAVKLMARMPRLVRLNGAEFTALANAETSEDALKRYALDRLCTVALTGATDSITDGARVVAIENGDPLMSRVTALGCAGTALVTACLAVEVDPWLATVAGLLVFAVAGECASVPAGGPGSFAVELLDALANVDRETLRARARLR